MNHEETSAEIVPIQDALQCWFLTGPTASGKSLIGLELAELIDAEIISLDSMAIYTQMDIGTAKPSQQYRDRVPHHLVDFLSPLEDYSVSQYGVAAHERIQDIRSRGKEVLFVGGTPLYLKSLLRGLYNGPPADWEFREQVERELQEVGSEALLERLRQVDPLAAHKLHPHDTRRIIRALEVYKVTGEPASHLQIQFENETPAEQCRVFVLGRPRPYLHTRIERRVEGMFEEGLVEEVRGLLDEFDELGRTAAQAVGYREVIGHLAGDQDLGRTIEMVKARTRQFARRQETWFRHLTECRRIEIARDDKAADSAARIAEIGERLAESG